MYFIRIMLLKIAVSASAEVSRLDRLGLLKHTNEVYSDQRSAGTIAARTQICQPQNRPRPACSTRIMFVTTPSSKATQCGRSTQRPHEACCASLKGTETEQLCIHGGIIDVTNIHWWKVLRSGATDLLIFPHTITVVEPPLELCWQCRRRDSAVSHSGAYSHNSLPRPRSCSRDIDGRLRGADGWQPKSLPTASGRESQPAGGDPESNRGCPGPVTSRVTGALDIESGEG